MHLISGVVAGAVILVMCVTGVLLTYEKQLLEWADRGMVPLTAPDAAPMGPEALLSATGAEAGATATALTLRADGRAAATVSFQGNRTWLVKPATGQLLGEPSPRLRRFFRQVTAWHRWLAMEGAGRSTGRIITGASNLGFLWLVLSGAYLWVPRAITAMQVRQVLWFRRGLTAKARDFNWHNVIGVWSAVPLALVVVGAVPISYGWAGDLVYRLAGEAPPARPAQAPAAVPRERRSDPDDPHTQAVAVRGLDDAVMAVMATVPDWRTMTAHLRDAPAPLTVSVDRGYAGQPQYRTTFTIDRTSSRITRREDFADLGTGRRWRSWLRFVHTGEYYGLVGQTVAGLVSAGGAVLVYSGGALAIRRVLAWRRRRMAGPRTLAA